MKAIITRTIPNPLKLPIVTSNGGWQKEYDATVKELLEHPFVDIPEEVDIEFIELFIKQDCLNCNTFDGQYMHCCIDNKSYRECNFGFGCVKYNERKREEV